MIRVTHVSSDDSKRNLLRLLNTFTKAILHNVFSFGLSLGITVIYTQHFGRKTLIEPVLGFAVLSNTGLY